MTPYIVIYVLLVLVSVVLGMAGKLEMRWVLLWEALLLLPFTLLILVGLRGTRMDMNRIRELYLPGVRR